MSPNKKMLTESKHFYNFPAMPFFSSDRKCNSHSNTVINLTMYHLWKSERTKWVQDAILFFLTAPDSSFERFLITYVRKTQ